MKDGIRKVMLKKRMSLEKDMYDRYSYLIRTNILKYIENRKFKSIAMYYPFRKEVDLLNLIDLLKDKDILFPKIKGKDMYFVKISSFDEFEKGKYGIMEPVGEIYNKIIDIFLIPGIAFDERLFRLGYGGGYYDRYFSKYKKGLLIGTAFDFQILKDVPTYNHDIKMDVIITEKRIIKGDNL
ncbi:5-formyltetrahydrofolate cyclo-ligase [Marinitoga hydrogenitolerans DSM 16785]|uniref:5-formyltetrahydrofolate cyclo-ligase n=1 Tax=Marinitoga hydrogenitolerans (strain DSM 16785 / JCM 12826 / AT1271) TaxID=1122195 RepID=A0A1M4S5Q9_MARH1|nr:5-formyltetrahydrofolate cyclo-ligase [Marinitoga hydrogenitolerans]SHE27357.1 5-formyltetrahydrofolate cyclo-ligase [Marinitoga hydrogenitolerans DSM 16785]